MAKTQKILSPADKLKELCPLLAATGVTRVVASYDGSGDSGDLSDCCFYFSDSFAAQDAQARDSQTSGHHLYFDAFKNMYAVTQSDDAPAIIPAEKLDEFYELLFEMLPGGWEINEGSYGEIEIDVIKSKIKHTHNERVVETNTSQQEW